MRKYLPGRLGCRFVVENRMVDNAWFFFRKKHGEEKLGFDT